MSNVITFLEQMGQHAQFRHASQREVESAMVHADIAPELQAAILAKDQQKLGILLGSSNVCCMVVADVSNEDEHDLGQCA